MTNSVKVSVIVPSYNVEKYLAEALASLKNQTFDDFEVLIVDDGSTDNTATVAKSFCMADNRFCLLSKPNGGLSSARNWGMKHAQGKYIALLDADDAYKPTKLEKHVSILDSYPKVGLVYGGSRVIRDDGKKTFMHLSGKPLYPHCILSSLICKNFVGHGSNAVFRRSIVNQVGYFDEALRSSEDIDYWLRIASLREWEFYRDKELLCKYRLRPTSLSFNINQMQSSHEKVMLAAHERNPELAPIMPTAYAHMYRFLAKLALLSGDSNQANELLHKSLQSDARIFIRDPRSLLTFFSIKVSPITRTLIQETLNSR